MPQNEIDFTQISALVVEDEAGGVAIIGVMMRYLGIKTYINVTGEGVVEMALSMQPAPHIIFLDLMLPRSDGYKVLKAIRADKRLKTSRVVAVTAQDADSAIPKCQVAGFDAFIGKPLSRRRFPGQIRRILSGEPVWETYS
ncbi:MAG: response regulator [Anaerolineae bacterium]|nr:response regulator [Anaerolineae bacterium]